MAITVDDLLRDISIRQPKKSNTANNLRKTWSSGNTTTSKSKDEDEEKIVAVRPNGTTITRKPTSNTSTATTEVPVLTSYGAPDTTENTSTTNSTTKENKWLKSVENDLSKYQNSARYGEVKRSGVENELKANKNNKLDTWLDSNYKLSKDEEKKAKQIVDNFYSAHKGINATNPKIVEQTRLSMTPEEQEEYRKINALDNKVSNAASFFGGAMDAVPFLSTALDKAGEKLGAGENSFSNTLANQKKQNPVATTAGEFTSKGAQYGALGSALGEGSSFLSRLGLGQAADTILDTVPELVSNTIKGKYDKEDGTYDVQTALLDVAKNQGINLAFNLGAEGVAGIIKGVKALRGVNGELDNALKDLNIDQIKQTDSIADEARAIAKNERSNDLNYLMKQFNEKSHLLPGDSIADEAKAIAKNAESNDLTTLMKQFNESQAKETVQNVPTLAKQEADKLVNNAVDTVKNQTNDIPKLTDEEIDEILENPVIKEALEKTESSTRDSNRVTNGSAVKKVGDDNKLAVGKATTINSPYKGKTPTQTLESRQRITIPKETVDNALTNMEVSGVDSALEGKNQKKILTKVYQTLFGSEKTAFDVPVNNMKFDNADYSVTVNKNAIGKIVSDPNMSAEKLAVIDNLEDVIKNSEYVGSGDYVNYKNLEKNKNVTRYDYFETDAKINGQDYVVTFDVEVVPGKNNYRTHKVINEINLTQANDTSNYYASKVHTPSGESNV